MYTPVILCGGSGTRLWPLSRTAYPKQLLPLVDEKSLLQQTVLRVSDLPGVNQIIVICNQDYRFIVAEQLKDIGIKNARIILEPEGKNTAPAAAIAALHVAESNPDALMLVLPSDNVINDKEQFLVSLNQAVNLASQDTLVTFGINPSRPETGYGYIQKGEALAEGSYQVKQFVEKPDAKTAAAYVESQQYFWNGGMFMFKASVFLQELELYAPDILKSCRDCLKDVKADLDFYRLQPESFSACRSESIDYAVMEKSKKIAVVTLRSDWSDVGSWSAIADTQEADANGNVMKGDVLVEKVNNCYLRSESRLVAAVGISDLVVVETADAILISSKGSSQEVKDIVNHLKKAKRHEAERHIIDYRPWGYYEILNGGANYKAKRLVVKPGAKLSLQQHRFRSEHWVVISGTATVTCGEECFELEENQSTFIPAGFKHRLENNSQALLEVIEVQTGSYFGEDDIVRFDDIYQREVDKAEPVST